MTTKKPQFHESLVLENFTAFGQAQLQFSPGVNAIIGENGTGKTHILKALYAAQLTWLRNNGRDRVQSIFQIENSIGDLVRSGSPTSKISSVSGTFGGTPWSFGIQRGSNGEGRGISDGIGSGSGRGNSDGIGDGSGSGSGRGNGDGTGDGSGSGSGRGYGDGTGEGSGSGDGSIFVLGGGPPSGALTPIFIPAVDMLGHTKGFVSTYDNYKIDFDLTHREIVSLLLSPEKRELPEHSSNLVSDLTKCLGGSVELIGERFFLIGKDRRLPMPSVAEGLRKIATLIRLVQTGWLTSGSTLFWDEPEVNLNPVLMGEVIKAILSLARSGVQVFLATHSYVILKELDLQLGKNEDVRFFALRPTETGTEVCSFHDFSQLAPNAILEEYNSLYDRELGRATRRPVKRAN